MIVARISQANGGSRVRVSVAQAIVDAKVAIGIGATSNTSYGAQTNDRLRAFASARGVPASELPPPSVDALWRRAPVLPASVVRLMIWAAYASSMPLSAVTIESAQGVPRWGLAATGARAPAQREALATRETAAVPDPPPPRQPPAPEASTPPPGPPTREAQPAAERDPTDNATGCVATMPSAWHLRDTETAASMGRAYPAGERVELLGAVPGVSRNANERFFRVRVVSDRREGFAFVPSASLPACAPPSVGDGVGSAISTSVGETLKLVGKVAGGVVATAIVLASVAAVVRRRRARAALRLNPPPPAASPQKATRSP